MISEIENDKIIPEAEKLEKFDLFDVSNRQLSFFSRFCSSSHSMFGKPTPGTVKAIIHKFPEQKSYAVTILDLDKQAEDIINPESPTKMRMDFTRITLEHILYDEQCVGYDLKSLLYLQDKQILAVSKENNGHITFWRVGDSVELRGNIQVGEKIKCMRYMVLSEEKKYLIIGGTSQIFLYDFTGENLPVLERTFQCESGIGDIVPLPDKEAFICISQGNDANIYSLKSFAIERLIDLGSFGVKTPVISGVYIKEEDVLALEDREGLKLVSLKASKNSKKGNNNASEVQSYVEGEKECSGLLYLPFAKQFFLKKSQKEVLVLDSKTMKLKVIYPEAFGDFAKGKDFNFIANQNESQILSNSNHGVIHVYNQGQQLAFSLNKIILESYSLEVLPDQYRFVVGDRRSGTLMIFQTNMQKGLICPQYGSKAQIISEPKKPVKAPVVTLPKWGGSMNSLNSTNSPSSGYNAPPIIFSSANISILDSNPMTPPPQTITISKNIRGKKAPQPKQQKQKVAKVKRTQASFMKNHPTSLVLRTALRERKIVKVEKVEKGEKKESKRSKVKAADKLKKKTLRISLKIGKKVKAKSLAEAEKILNGGMEVENDEEEDDSEPKTRRIVTKRKGQK